MRFSRLKLRPVLLGVYRAVPRRTVVEGEFFKRFIKSRWMARGSRASQFLRVFIKLPGLSLSFIVTLGGP